MVRRLIAAARRRRPAYLALFLLALPILLCIELGAKLGGAAGAAEAAVALVAATVAGDQLRRQKQSLRKIELALQRLAAGEREVPCGTVGSDPVGRLWLAVRCLRDALDGRRTIEEEANGALRRKAEIVDQVAVGIVVERHGLIVACNRHLAQLFGCGQAELIGSSCRSLYAGDADFARVAADFRAAASAGAVYAGEARMRRKDGKVFQASLRVDAGADRTSASSTWVLCELGDAARLASQALSRQRRLEALLEQKCAELDAARQRCAAAGPAPVEGGTAPAIGPIGADSAFERQRFDPAALLEGVASLAQAQASGRGTEIIVHPDPRLPPAIVGPAPALAHALGNLLGHAIGLARGGEIVLSASAAEAIRLEFAVHYRAAAPAPARSAGGQHSRSGRLEIAGRLAEAMGARLALDNADEGGSVLRLSIEVPGRGAAAPASAAKPLAGRRIMVIDDSRAGGEAIAAMLATLGAEAETFESGAAALAALAGRRGDAYFCICIDRRLPGADGLEFARALRGHFGPLCPPLLLMAFPAEAVQVNASQHGIAAVLTKPLGAVRLGRQLAALVGRPPVVPDRKVLLPGLRGKRALLVSEEGSVRDSLADFLFAAGIEVRSAASAVAALLAADERRPDWVLVDGRLPAPVIRSASVGLRALGLPVIALATGDADDFAGASERFETAGGWQPLLDVLAKWAAPARAGRELPPLPQELDVESGLRHLRGKTELFLKALRLFRDSCGQRFQSEFSAAVAAGDWATSSRLANNLRGMAATIGAHRVSAAAARLEEAIRSNDYERAKAQLPEVTEKLRILVEGLASIG